MKKFFIFSALILFIANIFASEEISSKNFMQKVSQKGDKIVIFYVPEDPNSKDLNKTIQKIDFKNIKLYMIHAGKNKDLTLGMGVQFVPTILFFKGNTLKAREVGAKNKKELEDLIKKYLKDGK